MKVIVLLILSAIAALAYAETCTSVGDPHFKTFDNFYYDLYKWEGDFLLHTSPNLIVQTKLTFSRTWGTNSLNKAIVVKFDENVLEHTGDYYVYNGAKNANINNVKAIKVQGNTWIVSVSTGQVVEFHLNKVNEPQTNYYLNIYINVPSSMKNKVSGLCGDFNGDKDDDKYIAANPQMFKILPATDLFDSADLATHIVDAKGEVKWASESARLKAESICNANAAEKHLFQDCMSDMLVSGNNADIAAGYKKINGDLETLAKEASKSSASEAVLILLRKLRDELLTEQSKLTKEVATDKVEMENAAADQKKADAEEKDAQKKAIETSNAEAVAKKEVELVAAPSHIGDELRNVRRLIKVIGSKVIKNTEDAKQMSAKK